MCDELRCIMDSQLESILSNFFIYSEIWRVKSMFAFQACSFMTFESKLSGFLMSQPLKSIVNIMVFIDSAFSVFS